MSPLYKFIADPLAARFLLQGIIKFTPIAELNDPSELLPNIIPDEVRRSLADLRERGYSDDDMVHLHREEHLLQRLAPAYRASEAPLTKEQATELIRSRFYDAGPLLYGLLDGVAREMASRVGLFCLTRRCDALPMWAHYAADARGLVVEFQELDNPFPGDKTGVLCEPIEVRYERERVGVTFDPRSHGSIFFTKYEDWGYEQEVRVVLPLDECRQHRDGDTLLNLFDIPRTCITRIILGWNIAPEHADAVRASARELNPAVEVVQACFLRGRVCVEGDDSPGPPVSQAMAR